jgi:hypothetical protein
MDPKKVIMTKRIETDLRLYAMFFDHEWARALAERVSSTKLEPAFDNLCVAWKEASNTHRLPWLMITQMEAFVGGYVRGHRPYGMRLIDILKIRLTRELGDGLRHMQKKKIDEVLETIDRDFRDGEKDHEVSLEPCGYWNMLVKQEEFQSSIWGSQNLSYCALIFAYEWFMVSCFRLLGGLEKARPNEDRFWAGFQTALGRDVKPDYWDDKPVKIARLARNCIAHTGGKAKQELPDESPSLFISTEGIITIQPSDTRDLFTVLKNKVTPLVDEVLPKLV